MADYLIIAIVSDTEGVFCPVSPQLLSEPDLFKEFFSRQLKAFQEKYKKPGRLRISWEQWDPLLFRAQELIEEMEREQLDEKWDIKLSLFMTDYFTLKFERKDK